MFHFVDYEERLPSETFLIWKDVSRQTVTPGNNNSEITYDL